MQRNNEVRVDRQGDLFPKRLGMFVLDAIHVPLLFLNIRQYVTRPFKIGDTYTWQCESLSFLKDVILNVTFSYIIVTEMLSYSNRF